MTTNVEDYLEIGCGRCPLGGTPDCKVRRWQQELRQLRRIVLDCGLTEESKWGVPCYTFKGTNVIIVSAFKEYCSLSFFKGALLGDAEGILEKPGEHSQAVRLARFTNVQGILAIEPTLKAYIYEAIEVEKAGLKVELASNRDLEYPEELENKFIEDPMLKAAFEALTPGRQRGYIIHFSQPKQAKTRESRIEKYAPQILSGIGMYDHYKMKK